MAASISVSVLMPAKMPKLLRFASTPPLQRHSRKAPAAVPGSDARNAVAVICAIYEAAKTGRTVQVK
jgi:predicted dehydrogenase